jgi:hypothetical protein
MNHIFTYTTTGWSLYKVGPIASDLPTALLAIARARGFTGTANRAELEDEVLRMGGYAWPIGAEAAPLHAQIAQLIADKAAADEAARLYAEAHPSPEQIWWGKLNGTLIDATTGIEISASENVRNILTGQLVMVTTAISVGAITTSTMQDIWDVHGVKHSMPASELIGLILRHGQAWAAMFAEFAP